VEPNPGHDMTDNYQPYLDGYGRVHWPILLMYPEYQLTDLIGDACEEDHFRDHLDVVFEDPAPWDQDKKYTPNNLSIYFEAKQDKGKVGLAKVSPNLTFKKILSHPNYFLKGNIPSFFVVAKGSDFEKTFVDSYKQKQ